MPKPLEESLSSLKFVMLAVMAVGVLVLVAKTYHLSVTRSGFSDSTCDVSNNCAELRPSSVRNGIDVRCVGESDFNNSLVGVTENGLVELQDGSFAERMMTQYYFNKMFDDVTEKHYDSISSAVNEYCNDPNPHM